MKKIVIVLILLFGTFSGSALAQKMPEWYIKLKKIELLKSTENDVVRLYGEPINPKSRILKTFETDDGDLTIMISTGKCGTEHKNGYNVEAGVIERIRFSVNRKSQMKAKYLGIKLSKFEKSKVSDVPGVFFYNNPDSGVDFYLERGLVSEIGFNPSSEYEELFCS